MDYKKSTMRKKILLLPVLLFCLFGAQKAFSQAKETTGEILQATHPAFTEDFKYSEDIVTGAILQRLKKDGISATGKRNLITGKGVQYAILAPGTIDVYFQVTGRGKKGRDGSTVNLFISRGQDNFVNRNNDPVVTRNALHYLNGLNRDISRYALSQQITQQQKNVDNRAKDYKKLLKDARKLEGKRYDLQKDISGETDQAKQDKYRKKLDKLNKNIRDKQSDVNQTQRDLERQKDQLSLLQDQLANQS